MRGRSLILDTTARVVFDAILVFSVYLLFAGHNQPGGGFVGGLVAAAAISLRFLAGGVADVDGLSVVRPWTMLAVGLLVAAGSAIVPMVWGRAPLDQRALELALPVFGTVKATTATIFDAGVYVIVVSLVLMAFDALGEPDDEPDRGVADGESLR